MQVQPEQQVPCPAPVHAWPLLPQVAASEALGANTEVINGNPTAAASAIFFMAARRGSRALSELLVILP